MGALKVAARFQHTFSRHSVDGGRILLLWRRLAVLSGAPPLVEMGFQGRGWASSGSRQGHRFKRLGQLLSGVSMALLLFRKESQLLAAYFVSAALVPPTQLLVARWCPRQRGPRNEFSPNPAVRRS